MRAGTHTAGSQQGHRQFSEAGSFTANNSRRVAHAEKRIRVPNKLAFNGVS